MPAYACGAFGSSAYDDGHASAATAAAYAGREISLAGAAACPRYAGAVCVCATIYVFACMCLHMLVRLRVNLRARACVRTCAHVPL